MIIHHGDNLANGRPAAGDFPAAGAAFSIASRSPFPAPAVSVDWLEFTLFTSHSPAQIVALLGLGDTPLETLERGLLGYRARHMAGPVMILTDGAAGMGSHVILSGGALRQFDLDAVALLQSLAVLNTADYTAPPEEIPASWAETPTLYRALNPAPAAGLAVACRRVKISRLDLALDDFAGALPLPLFAAALAAGNVTSRARRFGVVEGGEIATGKIDGRTYYVGQRGSRAMCRLYDKRQEQIAQGQAPADLPEIWNRCEMELRDESAENAAGILATRLELMAKVSGNAEEIAAAIAKNTAKIERFAGDPAGAIRAIISNFLAVRVPAADSNKSRWPVATWWQQFIDTPAKLGVGLALGKPDMARRRAWFDRQCGKAAVLLQLGYGRDYLRDVIRHHAPRLTEEEIDRAEQFAAKRAAEKPAPLPLPPLACPSCGAVHDLRATSPDRTGYDCENCGAFFVTNRRPFLTAA